MAVISVSPSRALRRPLRLDVRALVGILLMLVATGGSIAVWSTEQDTRGVLVAARDLPAGATLQATDLTVSRARLDDGVYNAAVPAESLNSLVGRQLSEPIHANQLLAKAQLSSRPRLGPDQMVIAIPLRSDQAAGGRIRAGDAVEVLSTDTKRDGQTHVVLSRVTVYEVGRDASGGNLGQTSGNLNWITLVVDAQQAVQLAQAKYSGEMDVTLLPPSS